MADAGRILIIPRGDYNANSTYEKLDLVKHKGTSWLAKKNATGVEPSEANAEFWQDVFDIEANRIKTIKFEKSFTIASNEHQLHSIWYYTNEIQTGITILSVTPMIRSNPPWIMVTPNFYWSDANNAYVLDVGVYNTHADTLEDTLDVIIAYL